MKKHLGKYVFALAAVLMLAPWPVAYAYEQSNAASQPVSITAAPPAQSWRVFGGAIGGIDRPVDLFLIDSSTHPTDVHYTLHFTNTGDLVHNYRYLMMKVAVYRGTSDGGWTPATSPEGSPLPPAFLTLTSAQNQFTLPGMASYKIVISGGSYCTFPSLGAAAELSPEFYLDFE